jgi:hypothetical protein
MGSPSKGQVNGTNPVIAGSWTHVVEAGSLVGKDEILCCDMGLGVCFSRTNPNLGLCHLRRNPGLGFWNPA